MRIKRNPVKKSRVLAWIMKLRNRRKIVEQLIPKEQAVKASDGVVATA